MAGPFRKLAVSAAKRANALRGPVSVAERLGARWVLAKDNFIDKRLLARGPFEERQLARFRETLAGERFDAMLDVGANFGLYAILAAKAGVREVHAVEPCRRTHNQLCANIFANAVDAQVVPHRIAAGAEEGEATLKVAPLSMGISRIGDAGDGAREDQFTQHETVAVRRLDDVLALAGRRLYVKVDVEGFETPALEGMARLLADNVVTLQVETFANAQEGVAAFMGDLGYVADGAIDADHYFTNAATTTVAA